MNHPMDQHARRLRRALRSTNGQTWMTVRPARDGDAAKLAELLRLYMRETYDTEWHGSEAALRGGGPDVQFRMNVALDSTQTVVGFVAWSPAYDLHWCVSGGVVLDLYVRPSARGRTMALRLLSSVASAVRAGGGSFLRGRAVDSTGAARLYARAAVCESGLECTLSGRAFRQLAELENSPTRELVRSLPDRSWNYEP